MGSGTTEDFSLSIFLYHFFFNDEDALFYFVKALVILQLRFIAAAAAKSISCVQLFTTPWTLAQVFSVLHYLPEFA